MQTETLDPKTASYTEDDEDVRPAKGWVVIVFNDNHHTFDYVIECLCKVVCLSPDKALIKALEIHETGQSIVAGPMSKYEATEVANKIAKYGPDKLSLKPDLNVGLKTKVEEA